MGSCKNSLGHFALWPRGSEDELSCKRTALWSKPPINREYTPVTNTSKNVDSVNTAMTYLSLDLSLIGGVCNRGRETPGPTVRSQVIKGLF